MPTECTTLLPPRQCSARTSGCRSGRKHSTPPAPRCCGCVTANTLFMALRHANLESVPFLTLQAVSPVRSGAWCMIANRQMRAGAEESHVPLCAFVIDTLTSTKFDIGHHSCTRLFVWSAAAVRVSGVQKSSILQGPHDTPPTWPRDQVSSSDRLAAAIDAALESARHAIAQGAPLEDASQACLRPATSLPASGDMLIHRRRRACTHALMILHFVRDS